MPVLRLKSAKEALSLRMYGDEGRATDELHPKDEGDDFVGGRRLRRRRKDQ
jgi:hypothetical protein